jgi:hypothetical protein
VFAPGKPLHPNVIKRPSLLSQLMSCKEKEMLKNGPMPLNLYHYGSIEMP